MSPSKRCRLLEAGAVSWVKCMEIVQEYRSIKESESNGLFPRRERRAGWGRVKEGAD